MAEQQIKDRRGWSAIDYGYLDNPKMLDVLDASPTAVLTHLASVLYCAQHLTDGHLAPGVARRKVGGSRDDEALLIDAGLWHAEGHDCPDCPQPEPRRVYVHDFLEHNRTAARAKSVSKRRSEAAKARWAKRETDPSPAPDDANCMQDAQQSAMQDAMQDAMQTDDVCYAEREKEREKETNVTSEDATPPREDVEALCNHLADRIEQNGSKRPTIGKRWRDAARLMIDRDGRTPEQIRYLIDWSQADGFWKGNILSMPTLRTKFDTLRLQSQRPAPGQQQQQRVGVASQMDALRFYGEGAANE